MPHVSNFLRQLTAVAAVALLLGSCHRAEYATLPRTSPYHATYHAPVPTAPAATGKAKVAATGHPPATPATSTASAATAAAPVAAVPEPAKAAVPAPRKAGLLQKMLAKKMVKKADKLTAKLLKQPQNTAEVNRISGYLRTGLLLVIIGLLITILPGGSFNTIGTIVAIIGVVFLVLWLLNEL